MNATQAKRWRKDAIYVSTHATEQDAQRAASIIRTSQSFGTMVVRNDARNSYEVWRTKSR